MNRISKKVIRLRSSEDVQQLTTKPSSGIAWNVDLDEEKDEDEDDEYEDEDESNDGDDDDDESNDNDDKTDDDESDDEEEHYNQKPVVFISNAAWINESFQIPRSSQKILETVYKSPIRFADVKVKVTSFLQIQFTSKHTGKLFSTQVIRKTSTS